MKFARIAIVVVAVILAVTLAGCKNSSKAKSAASNPVVKADEAKEQQVIQLCLQHESLPTKTARKAFFTCASGGMTPAAFEACATRLLGPTSLLSKSGRNEWVTAIGEKCVVTK